MDQVHATNQTDTSTCARIKQMGAPLALALGIAGMGASCFFLRAQQRIIGLTASALLTGGGIIGVVAQRWLKPSQAPAAPSTHNVNQVHTSNNGVSPTFASWLLPQVPPNELFPGESLGGNPSPSKRIISDLSNNLAFLRYSSSHKQGEIRFYRPTTSAGHPDPNFIFTNFYVGTPLEYNGVRGWKTPESCFQAAKFANPLLVEQIWRADSPKKAKRLAQQNVAQQRPDWFKVNVHIMWQIINARYAQDATFRGALDATQGFYLIEESPDDRFWGAPADCNTWGDPRQNAQHARNMLGELLTWKRVSERGESPTTQGS